ncbi:VCBS repeat-containing protein [Sediminicola luteus]|uniref:ASPIC/UnbV domain-containing protein n=1 Tax=Sediminicola luteus TaxID=319238 RepID=A0A2A4G980_9FLAO|nr:VCBS repeat-containing protein [Sediminicola luteus]PCE64538.1 hypothetical protein B7P33_09655 [Sediminicola luteus]
MNFYRYLIALFPLLWTVSCQSDKKESNESTKTEKQEIATVFSKLPAARTKVTFNNEITENLETNENLFNYDFFYNGAGVGVADLNNDGLQDLFFCGNQKPNALYLNQGNLTFKDISVTAGINKGKTWTNGVSFVDINQDGHIDIYLSQGGPNGRDSRKNLLYINTGDNSYTEEAENYGLADTGISTQSAFFDFDKDGDLDCIVMNESELYGYDPIRLNQLFEANQNQVQHYSSSHLYRNDNGKFTDITQEAGLSRPIFGLGLGISDFNDDGFLDFYISSDYYLPDALFINNGNGTFTDKIKEYTQQISYYGMGLDIADLNNDGLQDIFVLDMAAQDHVRSKTLMASMNTKRFDYLTKEAGYHHQYMYNSVQLNQGNNKYTNIAQLTKMANTDWSWSVLMADFDNDSDRDVHITNGYRRYALDNDLQRQVFEAKRKYQGKVPLAVKKQLYNSMPSEKLRNILYENQGNLKFNDQALDWGLTDFTFSNGAAIADLDNDGDLDLIVNNMDEEASIYENNSPFKNNNYLRIEAKGNLSESYPKVEIIHGNQQQIVEHRRIRGYRSAQEDIIHFGLGESEKIDTVRISWPSGKYQELYDIEANQKIRVSENGNTTVTLLSKETNYAFTEIPTTSLGLDYRHIENEFDDFAKEILLPYKQSTLGPCISQSDINHDGFTDLFIGGAAEQPATLFLGHANGFKKQKSPAFEQDRQHEDVGATFFDFEGDGDLDLFVVSGGNEYVEHSSFYTDRLYLNDGKGKFTRKHLPTLSSFPKSGKVVKTLDFDQDGDQDLIVGNRIRAQQYPLPAPSILYENTGSDLIDVTEKIAPGLLDFGIVNDIAVTDYNKDGISDFIAVGEWTDVGVFVNQNGTFKNYAKDKPIAPRGWWFSVTPIDINADGHQDYLLGNVGLNLKFKATEEKPFKIYSNDFDDNGTLDIVLSKKYNQQFVPVRGRECSSQQMPFIKQKFPTYNAFANATLQEVYGQKLDSAYSNQATQFKTLVLINNGDNTFEEKPLPIGGQTFPALSVTPLDFDQDGSLEYALAGNIYNTEVETPRLDGLSLTLLDFDHKNGTLIVKTPKNTGLHGVGNIKQIAWLKHFNSLLVLKNNEEAQIFQY